MRGLRQPAGHAGLRDEDPSSSGDGGGITGLTSTGGSIDITSPAGPTANLEIDPAHSVTSLNTLVGALVLSGDAAVKFAAAAQGISLTQFTVAVWPVGAATRRVFLVDGANGNDVNPGFLDGGASVFPISGATVAATAKKTIAGLASVFPRLGNGRQAEIIIAGGTYTDSLALLLSGVTGYANNYPIVRGTATSATAGCTAFDGSTADNTFLGAVTVTGLNAAGYNPTGAATNQVVTCTMVGGADPAFVAEPAAPLGWRIRFDAATSTAALRNVCRGIAAVSDDGTIGTLTAWTTLPAVPSAADVFYIEKAGVLMPGGNVVGAALPINTGTGGLRAPQLAGIQCTSAFIGLAASLYFVFCGSTGNSNFGGGALLGATTYLSADHGTVTAGGSLVNTGNLFLSGAFAQISNFVVTGTMTFEVATTMGVRTFVSREVQITGTTGTDSTSVFLFGSENQAGTGQLPCRILGSGGAIGLGIVNSRLVLGQIDITGVGAHSAVNLNESDVFQHPATGGTALTGATGNTLAGMVLVGASKYVKNFASPHNTVTGTTGDILVGATVYAWANAENTGLVLATGDRVIGVNGPVTAIACLAGVLAGAAGPSVSYLGGGGFVGGVNQTTQFGFCTSSRLFTRLRANVQSNTLTGGDVMTVELYKNGAPTGMKVTYAAGVIGSASSTATPVLFQDQDTFDVRASNTGADVGALVQVSSVLEGPV